MHHKRHALELLELFKQSRESARPIDLAEPGDAAADVIQAEEVKVDVFSRLPANQLGGPTPSTSYLPTITPAERRPNVVQIRKDTVVVGAVFILVFAGMSFLLGRRTSLLGTPPGNSEVVEASAPEVERQPLRIEEPASPGPIAEADAAPPAPKEEPAQNPPRQVVDEPPKAYTHVYQVATTGYSGEGAEDYKEYLLGNGFDAYAYQTRDGQWTTRVRSSDETKDDLAKIKDLPYKGHFPFKTAFMRHK